ncbi:MAG: dihydrolipoyl dehydrogenase [Bdellovibrio sp.]|nr:MAG: dihydrolipoyl dehydrogenase [Bdellovibrio sp.]
MKQYDVCVIGAGPGGYVAAIRCAQLGLKTAIVEREFLGGVCLNVGCIPSKAMITAAHFFHRAHHQAHEMGFEISDIKLNMKKLWEWKNSVCQRMRGGVEQLLKGNGIDIFKGEAQFLSDKEVIISSKEGSQKVGASYYIVATGSKPMEIPGFSIDEKHVLSSTGALDLQQLPKKIVIIGGGYIGLEMGTYLNQLGTKVEILEANDSLLKGVVEKEVVQIIERKLKKSGVQIHYNVRAQSYEKKGKHLKVKAIKGSEEVTFDADKILLMVGRQPLSDQVGLNKVGVRVNDKGFIEVNAQRRTSVPHIFAIGDVAGQPLLAHKASFEGVMVAEVIAGQNRVYDVKTVPAVIFTDPEIASVGWSEEECRKNGYAELKIGKFPFGANGRAVSLMQTEGFVKIIADAKTHVVLGVHMVGPEVSQLISEAALAIEMGARLEDIALTIHPHPTLGEVMMESAEAALGHAIHIIQKPLGKGNGAQKRPSL